MQRDNIILDVDSYKVSHFLQYPPNTEYISSYTVRIADAVGRKKVLVPVYKDGKVLKTYTFKEIRANSEA